MTGGDAIVRTLKSAGVTHVFGIPSVHNLPIYDALLRDGSIQVVGVRHEQGAVHAADGFARATGRLGVALTSTGPGAANGMPGLFEASFASSRVLMITGQIESRFLGKGKGFLHEAERQLEMLRSATRKAERVRTARAIPDTLKAVIDDICTGRPQPGALEIPIDYQYQTTEFQFPDFAEWPREAPTQESVDAAAKLLQDAERPLIWAGGGVNASGANAELAALAERLQSPVVTTVNGRGALPEDHALACGPFLGRPEVRDLISSADVVLAVGTRFQGNATQNWSLPAPRQLIHLDVDPAVVGRNYQPDVSMLADAREGLRALLDALDGAHPNPDFLGEARRASDAAREAVVAQIGRDHAKLVDALRGALPRDAVIVRDATVPAYTWGNQLLRILEPRTSLHSTSAAIGPALPLAIGAAVGTGRRALCVAGDGGFMLNLGELATAVEASAPVTICVFNDHGYGVLRGIQSRNFEGRQVGVDLVTPNFAELAEAFGMPNRTVDNVDAFEQAVDESLGRDGPTLIEVDLSGLAPIAMGQQQPRAAAAPRA